MKRLNKMTPDEQRAVDALLDLYRKNGVECSRSELKKFAEAEAAYEDAKARAAKPADDKDALTLSEELNPNDAPGGPDLRICEHCRGAGQDNDGENFINEPCPTCRGGGHFVFLQDWVKAEARIKELEAEVEGFKKNNRFHRGHSYGYKEATEKAEARIKELEEELAALKREEVRHG